MAAKSLPRWRLALRALVIAALVAKHWTRFWVGWVLLFLRASGRDRRRRWLGQVDRRSVPPARGHLHQGRADHEHPARSASPSTSRGRSRSCRTQWARSRSTTVVRTVETDLGRPLGDRVRRVRAGAAGVGVGVAGPQGAPPRRPRGGGQGAPAQRRPALHLRSRRDADRRARACNVIPSVSTLAPVAAVEEFGRAIFAQLDFRIEARNNRRFRENFRDQPA